jgi:hypothetical protein
MLAGGPPFASVVFADAIPMEGAHPSRFPAGGPPYHRHLKIRRVAGGPPYHRHLKIRRVPRPSSAWAGSLMLQSSFDSASCQSSAGHPRRAATIAAVRACRLGFFRVRVKESIMACRSRMFTLVWYPRP